MAPEPRPPQPIQPTFSLRLSGLPSVTEGKAIAAPAAAVEALRKLRRVESDSVFIMRNRCVKRRCEQRRGQAEDDCELIKQRLDFRLFLSQNRRARRRYWPKEGATIPTPSAAIVLE